jgi:hypothetical protein
MASPVSAVKVPVSGAPPLPRPPQRVSGTCEAKVTRKLRMPKLNSMVEFKRIILANLDVFFLREGDSLKKKPELYL